MLRLQYKKDKRLKKILGSYGEDLVAEILVEHFDLKLLKKNYRSPYGEVDLVMSYRSNIVIIEVKVDSIGKEDESLWSGLQRRRFFLSGQYLRRKHSCQVSELFALVRPRSVHLQTVTEL